MPSLSVIHLTYLLFACRKFKSTQMSSLKFFRVKQYSSVHTVPAVVEKNILTFQQKVALLGVAELSLIYLIYFSEEEISRYHQIKTPTLEKNNKFEATVIISRSSITLIVLNWCTFQECYGSRCCQPHYFLFC